VTHPFGLGDALQALELALGSVHVGDVGALVAQQVLGVGPALVLFADQVLRRHLNVVEPDFIDLALAVQQLDGTHRDPGRLHVDEQEGDTRLRFAFVAGAHEAEDPLAVLAQRGPGFLAVDDVFVALALGTAFD
jgi:hypothetical protein